jgi:hypothetical protein
MTFQGYFVIERNVDHVNETNWAKLIYELDRIVGVGDSPHQKNHKRDSLPTYEVEIEVDSELVTVVCADVRIYVANFQAEAVSFDKFKNRLSNLFSVPKENISYATSQRTIRNRPSVTAVYSLGGNERIAVELLGCASDFDLCTWGQSNAEVLGLLAAEPVLWGETVE